jgi:DNA-directed RNA polymerase, mitochondrial
MFSGANRIQEWLKECARRISKSLGPKDFRNNKPSTALPFLSTVVWTTPLGLPVCQPYRKLDLKSISTLVSSIYLVNPNSIGAVNVRKQMTAFPPNFIHSLDASHMLKSAIACNQAGLTFASVHDSFWTHACDVDIMNVVLREAFVRIHSTDLIRQLRDEFTERYKGHYFFEDKIKVAADTVDASDLDVYEGPNGKVITRRRQGTAWKPLEFPPIPEKVYPPLSRH